MDNSELLIFITKKKNTPPISESIRKSIYNLSVLASLPPVQGKRPSLYGAQAFNAWADSLLIDDDFKDENMLAKPLDTYGSCTVMLGTNMHYIQAYLNRAIQLCPDMKQQIEKLQQYFIKENEALNELIRFQGGYSFDNRKMLLNKGFRIEQAKKIRKIGNCYAEAAVWVCNICGRNKK